MKKLFLLFFIVLVAQASLRAQYVTIPDTSFRKQLKNLFPSCFNGSDMMDTTCSAIVNATSLTVGNDTTILNVDGLQYFKNLGTLYCTRTKITTLPKLPNFLGHLVCNNNRLTSIPILPPNISSADFNSNRITNLPAFHPSSILQNFECKYNLLTSLPSLPYFLEALNCSNNQISSLPVLPTLMFKSLICSNNPLNGILPTLPSGLNTLGCAKTQMTTLPTLPSSLSNLSCWGNQLTTLGILPSLGNLDCSRNQLTSLTALPNSIQYLVAPYNQITSISSLPSDLKQLFLFQNNLLSLPKLPNSLELMSLGKNATLNCLPNLPNSLQALYIDTIKIRCLPNSVTGLLVKLDAIDSIANENPNTIYPTVNLPICNPTNNPSQCISYPHISGKIYRDINSNNVKDANEKYVSNIKVQLKPNNYTYTNTEGKYELVADTIGSVTLTVTPPQFYNAAPATVAYNFAAYNNNIAQPDIALQSNTIKDSIKVTLTPIIWAARPGFVYPYLITYENIGTTQVTANIQLAFNDTLLTYDSSSRTGVQNPAANTLTYTSTNMVQGQKENWIAYFRVKTTASLNKPLKTKLTALYNSSSSADSVETIIRGSYDPNDKQGTPQLTPAQVAEGNYIDYTIRFQNTGTDTAFTVVIADTLSNLLLANSFQMIESSHTCKTTINDNIVYFEFFNILLPDSNVNKIASNGFVRFRVKPVTTVVNGNQIPNKAAIYFDYNSPIITNTVATQIATPAILPLTLVGLSAVAQNNQQILVYFNTVNENNTQQFEIEQSTDSRSFKYCTTVAANGSGSHNYYAGISRAFINNELAPIVYIRLKMIDKDGRFSYSKVVQLSFKKETMVWDIIGNPAKDYLNIVVQSNIAVNTTARITNSLGKVVRSIVLQQGLQSIPIADLPSGIYLVQTQFGTKRFVVAK